MSRRIWVEEGFAGDGDVYARALELPNRDSITPTKDIRKTDSPHQTAAVLKISLGDIPSCPCLSAIAPTSHETDDTTEQQGAYFA